MILDVININKNEYPPINLLNVQTIIILIQINTSTQNRFKIKKLDKK